jgi:hypothetical protein
VQTSPNKRLIADQHVKPHSNNRNRSTTTVIIAGYTIDRENAKPLGNSVIIATKSNILRKFTGQTAQQLEFDDMAGRLPPSQATADLYHQEGKINEIQYLFSLMRYPRAHSSIQAHAFV